jgi:hypothetical protein
MLALDNAKAVLPPSDSRVWNWGAVLSFLLAVLPDILRALIGQRGDLGIPDTWVRWFQVALLILGILAAKMSDGWGRRTAWSQAERQRYQAGSPPGGGQ